MHQFFFFKNIAHDGSNKFPKVDSTLAGTLEDDDDDANDVGTLEDDVGTCLPA